MKPTLVIVLLSIFSTISCQNASESKVEAKLENITAQLNEILDRIAKLESVGVKNHKSGVYQLEDPAITVYCKKTVGVAGGWIVIQQRVDRSLSFERSWKEYREGFGVVGENESFWLGNEVVHQMTTEGDYELAIEWREENKPKLVARYSQFRLAGEDEKYRLTVGGYSGSSSDNFGESNKKKFSTYDNDNDERDYGNCANVQKSGWWFSRENCGWSDLNSYGGPHWNHYGTFMDIIVT